MNSTSEVPRRTYHQSDLVDARHALTAMIEEAVRRVARDQLHAYGLTKRSAAHVARRVVEQLDDECGRAVEALIGPVVMSTYAALGHAADDMRELIPERQEVAAS